jgi:type IV secretory pathway VirJ component
VSWRDLIASGRTSVVSTLPGVEVIEAGPHSPAKNFYRAFLSIAGADAAFRDPSAGEGQVADLPFVTHIDPRAPDGDVLGLFLSGDGGWAPFDAAIADRLARAGVPVAGLSSLRYFWAERTPDETAADMSSAARHFSRLLGREKLLLIGFSLGANATPFYARRLDPDIRNRVTGIGLLAPESRTGFEIQVGGWLGRQTGDEDVAAEIDRLIADLPQATFACLYGTEEETSPCPDLAPGASVVTRAFDGGHHLAKDHDGIAEVLLSMVDARSTGTFASNPGRIGPD